MRAETETQWKLEREVSAPVSFLAYSFNIINFKLISLFSNLCLEKQRVCWEKSKTN